MKIQILMAIVCLIPIVSFGQSKNYSTEKDLWFEGAIQTIDGENLKGIVNYNFVVDVLRFDDGKDIKVHLAQNIIAFTINKEKQKKKYFSLPLENANAFGFYEILKETPNGALAQRHQVEISKRSNSAIIGVLDKNEKVIRTVYLLTKQGIYPILEKKLKNTYGIGFRQRATYNDNIKYDESVSEKEIERYKRIQSTRLEDIFPENHQIMETIIDQNELDLHTVEAWSELLDER